MHEPEFKATHTYTWSLYHDEVLTLVLIKDSGGNLDDPGILMATQHQFLRVNG